MPLILLMSNRPKHPAKNEEGDFDRFKTFAARVLAVPHSKIKSALDAEKQAKLHSKKVSSRRASAASARPDS
jgi:hypothetical protein